MKLKKINLLLLLSAIFFSCATSPKETVLIEIPEKSLYETNIEEAERGNSEAMVQVGISFEEGKGVTTDYDTAYEWYTSAAAKGDPHAYYRIGKCYEMGISVGKDPDSALEWYLSSASTGFSGAIRKMIEHYENSPDEQLKWIQRGLLIGDPYSNYKYGLIVELVNKSDAIPYFKNAINSDLPEIDGLLSILSLSGQYRYFNEQEALGLIEIASKEGDRRSQTFLGWLYEYGVLVDRDFSQAFNLYDSAAKSDDLLAIYNLSRFYGEGIFVEKDARKSYSYFNSIGNKKDSPVLEDLLIFCSNRDLKDQLIVLYRFKAAANDYDAYYNLGKLYGNTDGFQWFSMAADAGHIPSMYELGKYYSNEINTDYDPIRAAAWLMVYENKSGSKANEITSTEVLSKLTDEEKLQVSHLFTALFYNKESSENNTDFLK